jgi:hypothetical protein
MEALQPNCLEKLDLFQVFLLSSFPSLQLK